MKKNHNSHQDQEIAVIKTDVNWLKKEIEEIKTAVHNCLPTQIKKLEEEIIKNQLGNQKWFVAILVSLVFVLIGTIFNLLK